MAGELDLEWILADTMATYLQSVLDADLQSTHPIVTFFDPMSFDEANRVHCLTETAVGMPELPANFDMDAQVVVKTLLAEVDLADVLARHRYVTKWVRDKLLTATLAADLTANSAGLLAIHAIHPVRRYRTDIGQGFAVSDVHLIVRGFRNAA